MVTVISLLFAFFIILLRKESVGKFVINEFE